MKTTIIFISSFAAIVLVLAVVNQFARTSISTNIEINASRTQVWQILMDHQAYPDWNPFVKHISGPTQVGETLAVTVQSEGNDPMDFQPEVLVNSSNHEFRWVGKLLVKGLFDGEHYFILEETENGQTRLVHGENFHGILSGALLALIIDDTEKGFEAMNRALKVRAEQMAQN